MREPFADVLVGAMVNVTGRLLDVLPRLAALGLFVGFGALGAWAVSGMAQALLRAGNFDRVALRWGLWRALQAGGIRRSPSDVVGGLLGAATFALAALLALDAVETPGTGSITSAILGFLPRGLAGMLLAVLGGFAGRICEFGVRLVWARLAWKNPDLAGRGTRWAAWAVALGFALAVLGVPPVAMLAAAALPFAGMGLGATLGLAQVARVVARRAASRWVRSLSPSARLGLRSAPVHTAGDELREASSLRPAPSQPSSLSPQSFLG